ncbi:polysaccharide biosynthesis/export family protein [Ferruginibacter albus]|uniref:polysaccharide biosynthesis/export family protein n=1 Tax=Ferruginibacter albus TaxID=2875540 RepID=UPI001CC4CA0D|nr:SLBB domain-containing protein [Ferruginibacter albus]UAY52577.1 SLBB domain-containing protein [Ferruginibacter albus]
MLQQSGIDPTQMTQQNFRKYFDDNNSKKPSNGADINKSNTEDVKKNENKTLDHDSTQKDNIKAEAYNPEQTYGANVFQNTATYNVGELSTPPLDYPIGVGDHIIVALWGGGEYQEDYIVAKDGSIFPAGLGKIMVQGLKFEAARALIYSRFKSVVPASTNVEITLGEPRSINVNVGGEVANPGPVTISAFSNAFNVIGLAGGITQFGNLREIQIKRNGRVIDRLDVYKYLTSGDIGSHIYLQNNDFVLVTFYEKKVFATGQFKRPMYYQLKKEEGLKDLIRYSGGFTPDAFTSDVKVIRTEKESQVIKDVNATAILNITNQDFALSDGDIVKADLIRPGITNKVELKGEVAYPGNYELRKGDHLFDVINRAGGITKNTYLQRAFVFRGSTGDSTSIKSDRLEIDLTDINKDRFSLANPNNILLEPNDIIQLFASNEFLDEEYVEISGEVRKPGKVRRYGGMTLQDLLYLSGGLKSSAEFGRLEISSIVDMDSAKQGLKPTRTVIQSYAVLSNLALDSVASHIMLKPYDQVFVRKNPTFQFQENVQLLGLFKYPGQYSKLNKNERLSSYVNRAGGVRENADLSGAILFRNKTDLFRESIINNGRSDSSLIGMREPVSIDLEKALRSPNSKNDVVLQENDVIYLPEINPFVRVQGKVQSPLKITFDSDHKKLLYYIDKAGGFGIRPWRKRIYVTYANGKSKRTTNIFFIHFYPKVDHGSVITVPERPQGTDVGNVVVQGITATIPIIIGGFIFKYIK